jgi:hypothetical protein
MRVENLEKVLDRLATADKCTIVVERQPDGKMRVTSGSWGGEKVFLKDQGARGTQRPQAAACAYSDFFSPPLLVCSRRY